MIGYEIIILAFAAMLSAAIELKVSAIVLINPLRDMNPLRDTHNVHRFTLY
jgi:hypothetical protein